MHLCLWGGLFASGSALAEAAPATPLAPLARHRHPAAALRPIQKPETTGPEFWLGDTGVLSQIADPEPRNRPSSFPFAQEPLPPANDGTHASAPSSPPTDHLPLSSAPVTPAQFPDAAQVPLPQQLPGIQVPGITLPEMPMPNGQGLPAPEVPGAATPLPPSQPSERPVPATQPPEPQRSNCDPELGCLRLKPAPLPPAVVPKAPRVYLTGQVDYYRSSNIFAGIDPVSDGFVRPSVTLSFSPPLGRNTFLATSVAGSWFRYGDQSVNDLDEVRLNAGLFQRITPSMFLGLGWTNQKYYYGSNIPLEVDTAGNVTQQIPEGTRFFNENSVHLEIIRSDRLSRKLSLSTFYQLRAISAQPFSTRQFYSEGVRDRLGTTEDRSRILNTLVASLNYDLRPNLQAGLDYQFSMAHYTRQNRDDTYHQISARLNYTALRNTQFRMYGGYSFGDSSRSDINFNGFILGVTVSVNLALF